MDTKYQLMFEDFMALQKDSLKRTEHHQARYNITTIALAMMVFLFGFIVLHIILPMFLYFYSLYLNSENIFKLIVVCLAIIPVILLRPFIGKYYDFVTLRKLKSVYKNDTRWPGDVTLQLHETEVHVNSSYENGTKKLMCHVIQLRLLVKTLVTSFYTMKRTWQSLFQKSFLL
ncbi:hypothetical protein [Exiguobacterium sp. s155]|uniref:hypothetical protein n=1 Tax=Exiguobacterium sp. s155 TaxID=2751286 RepID=UPI001BEB4862|nr:hypothetical protein [Exiguobacterium sp. s155]